MNDDLDVKGAFDALYDFLFNTDKTGLTASVASGYLQALKGVDQVLQVLF